MNEFDFVTLFNMLDGVWAMVAVLWCFLCAVFVVLAPVTLTAKLPNWLMTVINISAGNVGNAANKLADLRGNPNEKSNTATRKTG